MSKFRPLCCALVALSACLSFSGCEVFYRSQMRQAARDYRAGKIGAAEYNRRVSEAQMKLEGYTRAMYAVGNAGFAASAQMQAQQPPPPVVVVAPQRSAQPTLVPFPKRYEIRRTGPGTYEAQQTGVPLIQ